jgi:hypothetical protein
LSLLPSNFIAGFVSIIAAVAGIMDFDSSDIEVEPAPSKHSFRSRPGQASIDAIVKNAAQDRLSSKIAYKQLQYGYGAPSTRLNQVRWTERFNEFRVQTLQQSLSTPFTGQDVWRFLDTIIGKLRPIGRDKPGPNETMIRKALHILIDYGTYTYPKNSGFEFTATDGARIKTWFSDAVAANRLTWGCWKNRDWLSFMTISHMSRAWLHHHSQNGTRSWDIALYKLLSIVLVTSLACRGGDIARSRGYTGTQYLQYGHIQLVLEGSPKISNLCTRVSLEYLKGFKDVQNHRQFCYLRPLEDPQLTHMCPISLLLIHALRHDLVVGTSLQQILDAAAARADKRVIWLFPDRPVLCSIDVSGYHHLDLEKPTGTGQLLGTVKAMGLISNILTRVCVHGIRQGAAQDIVHYISE